MKDNKLMVNSTPKGPLHPGDWNDIEKIGQRVLNEMMEYLKNISSKPEIHKPVEFLKENLEQGLCCN